MDRRTNALYRQEVSQAEYNTNMVACEHHQCNLAQELRQRRDKLEQLRDELDQVEMGQHQNRLTCLRFNTSFNLFERSL
jgi:hypothetical protein